MDLKLSGKMISRFMQNTVFVLRNTSIHSQLKWKLNIKCNSWKGSKLFHASAASFQNQEKSKTNLQEGGKVLKVWKNITPREISRAMNISLRDFGLVVPDLHIKPDDEIVSLELVSKSLRNLGWKLEIIKKPSKPQKETKQSNVLLKQPPSDPKNLVKRPPVVTVMGHVDHGKTTLLDSLRNTFVVEQEFGGITQHIGAFSVEVKPGERITFIDTPGHAAFTAMRSRGAGVTDLVVLVIAADDGIMKQTIESIDIATAANVPLIIAVNKIDKPTAQPIESIKQKLLESGVQVEEDGGDVQLVPISALKKINLDLLTEMILLQAELMNLTGDPTGLVEGVIIEAKKGKMGAEATLIIKRGTLTKNKFLVAGKAYAKVRRMLDENGNDYDKALPSTPVLVIGWRKLPSAGDEVIEVDSEKKVKTIILEREKQALMEKAESEKDIIEQKSKDQRMKIMEFKEKLKSEIEPKQRRTYLFELRQEFIKKLNQTEDTGPQLKILLKGDVYGTLEVLVEILSSYDKHDECKLSIVDASVGDITPGDLDAAVFFDAVVYAFNVSLDPSTKDILQEKTIEIRYHNVIYKLIDDLKQELSARISPKDDEEIHGEAEVLENFVINQGKKKVFVAGARCIKGQLKKESLYRVLRNGAVIYEGKLDTMKNEKKIVNTIAKGMECGLLFESFPEKFLPKDRIISYDMIKVPRETSWNPGF